MKAKDIVIGEVYAVQEYAASQYSAAGYVKARVLEVGDHEHTVTTHQGLAAYRHKAVSKMARLDVDVRGDHWVMVGKVSHTWAEEEEVRAARKADDDARASRLASNKARAGGIERRLKQLIDGRASVAPSARGGDITMSFDQIEELLRRVDG